MNRREERGRERGRKIKGGVLLQNSFIGCTNLGAFQTVGIVHPTACKNRITLLVFLFL